VEYRPNKPKQPIGFDRLPQSADCHICVTFRSLAYEHDLISPAARKRNNDLPRSRFGCSTFISVHFAARNLGQRCNDRSFAVVAEGWILSC